MTLNSILCVIIYCGIKSNMPKYIYYIGIYTHIKNPTGHQNEDRYSTFPIDAATIKLYLFSRGHCNISVTLRHIKFVKQTWFLYYMAIFRDFFPIFVSITSVDVTAYSSYNFIHLNNHLFAMNGARSHKSIGRESLIEWRNSDVLVHQWCVVASVLFCAPVLCSVLSHQCFVIWKT